MASLLTRGLQRLSLLAPSTLGGVRHASKKATGTGGTSKTSNPKYLGIKIYGDQFAKPGAIIYRQRGAKYVRMICTEHDTPQHALIPLRKSFGSRVRIYHPTFLAPSTDSGQARMLALAETSQSSQGLPVGSSTKQNGFAVGNNRPNTSNTFTYVQARRRNTRHASVSGLRSGTTSRQVPGRSCRWVRSPNEVNPATSSHPRLTRKPGYVKPKKRRQRHNKGVSCGNE